MSLPLQKADKPCFSLVTRSASAPGDVMNVALHPQLNLPQRIAQSNHAKNIRPNSSPGTVYKIPVSTSQNPVKVMKNKANQRNCYSPEESEMIW